MIDYRIDRNEIGFLYESFNHECVRYNHPPYHTHEQRIIQEKKKRLAWHFEVTEVVF